MVLTGPELDENRFYSLNERPEDGGGGGAGLPFKVRAVPYTVDLVFELVGISSYTVELLSLMNQCVLFFHKNKTIAMDRDDDLVEGASSTFDQLDDGLGQPGRLEAGLAEAAPRGRWRRTPRGRS